MTKECILENLQNEWNENNGEYSEDGFLEHVSDYCDKYDDEGFFINEYGKTEGVCDWVLHNLDLSR